MNKNDPAERLRLAVVEVEDAFNGYFGPREGDEELKDVAPSTLAFSMAVTVELWAALGNRTTTRAKAQYFQSKMDQVGESDRDPQPVPSN